MDYHRIRSEIPLIMASLFIAFVIWLIAKQGNLDSDWIEVPIQIENAPINVEIKTLAAAQVKFQFPQDLSNRIVTRNFDVVIKGGDSFSGDTSNWTIGALTKTVEYNLTRDNIRPRGTQFKGIEVLKVDPSRITLTGTLLTRNPAIEVVTTGTLPANFVFTAPPRPDPSHLVVTGSPEALRKLGESGDKIRTQPVDLATLGGSDQKFPELVMPPGILPVDKTELNRVTVDIGLTELDVSKTFYQVPINLFVFSTNLVAQVTPSTADILVEGPASVLEMLKPDDFTFQPSKDLVVMENRIQDVGIEAQLKSRVDPRVAQRVKIVEVTPPRITVEFVPADWQNDRPEAPFGQ